MKKESNTTIQDLVHDSEFVPGCCPGNSFSTTGGAPFVVSTSTGGGGSTVAGGGGGGGATWRGLGIATSILPSTQDAHLVSTQASKSQRPYPKTVLRPKQIRPMNTANAPSTVITARATINGPNEFPPYDRWITAVGNEGGGGGGNAASIPVQKRERERELSVLREEEKRFGAF